MFKVLAPDVLREESVVALDGHYTGPCTLVSAACDVDDSVDALGGGDALVSHACVCCM